MSEAREKPKRRYDASRRRARADETRDRVVEAAGRVFTAHGYAAATIPLIATEAGCSIETVYRSAPGKAGLLAAAVQAALAGGAARAEQPVEQRSGIRRVIDEPDPRRALRFYADTQPGLWARTGPLLRVLDEAAPGDAILIDLQRSIAAQRLLGQGRIADMLAERGQLRSDLPVQRARDIVWTLCGQACFDALVTARGWTNEEYRDWLADMLAGALLSS